MATKVKDPYDPLRDPENWNLGMGNTQAQTVGSVSNPLDQTAPSPAQTTTPPAQTATPSPQTSSPQYAPEPSPGAPPTTPITAPPATTPTPNAAGRGVSAEQYFRDAVQNFGLKARQSEPQSLNQLVNMMKAEGYNVQLAAPSSGGYVKGIMLNGQFVKLLDGNDNWIWDAGGGAGSETGAGAGLDFASLMAAGQGRVNTAPDPGVMAALQEIIARNSGAMPPVAGTQEALAYQDANQRNSAMLRSVMAERLAASGQGVAEGGASSGGFDTGAIGIAEDQAQKQAQFEADLTHRNLTERHDRLMQALTLSAGYLTDSQRLELQQELQRTNEAMQQLELQFKYDQLGFDISKWQQGQNTGTVGAGAGGS